MANPGFGASSGIFPILLGEVESGTFVQDASNTFVLSQTLTLEEIYRLAANRLFFFGAYGPEGQLATHNYFYEDVSNTFTLTGVSGYDWEDDIIQYFGFSGTRVNPGNFGNYFGFSGETHRVFADSLSNAFDWNLHDTGAALLQSHNVSNTFVMTQGIDGIRLEFVYDVFGWVDVVDTGSMAFNRRPTQSMLKQSVTFSVSGSKCPEKEYAPFIGSSGDDSYPAMSATPPTLGSGVLTLTHPRVSPTTTLVLKNPDFGNSDVLRFTKVDRRTRGGDRKIFSDLGWGSTQSFELTISNVCSTDVTIDEMLDFLNTSLGEEIGLLDWENRQWKGIIVAPETDVTPQRGGWSVRIIFEGELV